MEWGLTRDLFVIVTPVFVAGGLAYMVRQLNKDVGDIKVDLKLLNKIVTDVAVQSTRLDNFDGRLNDHARRLDRLETH